MLSNGSANAANTRTTRPITNTLMVFELQPFHSLRIIPQTLLNTTLRAIKIQNDNVVRASEEVRKPLPIDSPKNWLYQSAPAKRQNRALFAHTSVFL